MTRARSERVSIMYLTEEDNLYRDVVTGVAASNNKVDGIETYHLFYRTVSIHLITY